MARQLPVLRSSVRHASKTTHRGDGLKSTLPSTSKPQSKDALIKEANDGDRGYLAFTKSSLFKLTLPLQPPSSDSDSLRSKASSAFAKAKLHRDPKEEQEETRREAEESSVEDSEPWEKRADAGERVSQIDPQTDPKPSQAGVQSRKKPDRASANGNKALHEPEMGEPADDEAVEFDAKAPALSVVFLLHSAQPLSYISSLIEAEGPGFGAESDAPPQKVTFHSRPTDSKRWSPATSIGDFLQDAARIGSFAIRLQPPKNLNESKEEANVEPRNIQVSVPSFEDRTRYLRATLYAKTAQIESMAKLKAECDALARRSTRRFAIAGGVGLLGWWVTIFSITFLSQYGWDLAEPVTYLCGTAALMVGYTWFLVHNREVSYRAVLSETTTRRQQKLYIDKGFNIERYEELIEDCKELRKHIRKVATDYDLEYDQSNSSSGHYKRAIEIVQKREAQEQQRQSPKSEEEEEEQANKEKDEESTKESSEEKEEKKAKD